MSLKKMIFIQDHTHDGPKKSSEINSPSIWGIKTQQRIRTQIHKKFSRTDTNVEIIDSLDSLDSLGETSSPILILRSDVVYDTALLVGMMEHPGRLFCDDNQNPVAAYITKSQVSDAVKWLGDGENTLKELPVLSPGQAGASYRDDLRKKANPYAIIVNADNKKDIEWRLFKDSYKGVTDFVTKYWWPVPAYYTTKFCAKIGMSPNMVTSIGAALMFLALYFFWQGQFAEGLLAGWVMTFLDTVDGKLARVTLTSSKWGNIFDHGIDLLHPPFWYIAWGYGLMHYGTAIDLQLLNILLVVMFASYVAGRLCEGLFIHLYGFHIHVWRRIDSLFRLIVARRNPNMVIMTLALAAGRPDLALWFITIWHVAAVVIHLIQVLQAQTAKIRGQAITSWLQHG